MADLSRLNEKQKEAVLSTEGPLLILAGAGSGKTGTVIHRIAHLIDDCGVSPFNILAITFTNKAAGEMRDRVDAMIGTNAAGIWVSTFHAMCARILRRHAEYLGFTRNFTIYDTDDQKTLMRQLIREKNLDTKLFRERGVLAVISAAKNNRKTADDFYKESVGDYRNMQIAELFRMYQEAMLKNDAMDFDDLLNYAIDLLSGFPEVLNYYQERFRYIMVDEYQDTNTAQFELVRLLAGKYRNLCVVGDDDQSIYAFRGANIENILGFEKEYPGAKVIRLEQNYRSTGNILDVANALIRNNHGRKPKSLWTERQGGAKVHYDRYQSAKEEAFRTVREIEKLRDRGADLNEIAVLYRTNAQSRVLEESFIRENVPYHLIGGVNFYQRAEIKDMIAYLKTVESARDDIAVRRIINVPKRAIGKTTVDRITAWAGERDLGFFEACTQADRIPGLGSAAAKKVIGFTALIGELRKAPDDGIAGLMRRILEETGYIAELKATQTIEDQTRIENLEEFVSKAADYEEKSGGEETSLAEFLEEISLVADIDSLDDGSGRVALMTLHSSKGLEFDYVFLTGLEAGLFPSFRSVNDIENNGLEEERRLCYVGITRAKKELFLSSARERMVNGETMRQGRSQFLDEIPADLLDDRTPEEDMPRRGFAFGGSIDGDDSGGEFGYRGFSGRSAGGYGTDPYRGGGRGYGGSGSGSGYGSDSYHGMSERYRKTHGGAGAPGFGKQFPSYDEETARFRKSVLGSGGAKGGAKKTLPDYEVGDLVRHAKFGDGKVLVITEDKRDYMVTVDFEDFGIKKMLAGFAKLEKI
ncbi:MAG: UvrD-helicase domain-containing protein [Lachnospiraceae bacterium]|nr:UvrD-helicase domain-containing protein [Lachnospiraceae bacterium]